MGVLANPRHERYAQEVANGVASYKAYVIAGYKESLSNACTLRQRPDISERIVELLEKKSEFLERTSTKALNAAAIDKKWLLQELVDNSSKARGLGDIGSSNRALELVGKEMGMFINRSVSVDISADFANLDNAEAILAAVAKELGDDTAATLRALVAPRQAKPAMRTIEHDPGEALDADPSDELA